MNIVILTHKQNSINVGFPRGCNEGMKKVKGVEENQEAVRIAKQVVLTTHMTLYDLHKTFLVNMFAIILLSSLAHCENMQAVIKEIAHLVKQDGVFNICFQRFMIPVELNNDSFIMEKITRKTKRDIV